MNAPTNVGGYEIKGEHSLQMIFVYFASSRDAFFCFNWADWRLIFPAKVTKMLRMNEVIARHRKLVEQYPQNEMARFSLGKALFDDSQFAAAREQFAVALQRKPEWMAVQILLGKCDLQLGDRIAAKAAFERARQLAIEQNHESPREEMEELLAELQ